MIFNFYLFNRTGDCIFYREWQRQVAPTMPHEESLKLVYGLLFSIKSFVSRISPKPMQDGFHFYKTSTYKLNFFESATGLKFILVTDSNVGDIRDVLRSIYSDIYVEHVAKNILLQPHSFVKCEVFSKKLDEYIQALPFYVPPSAV
eukprot:Sdes_comp9169_c0_seq1m641